MKTVALIFILFLLVVISLNAQTPMVTPSPSVAEKKALTTEEQELIRVNQQTIFHFQAKNFDEALKFAQQSLELSQKTFGSESSSYATSLFNLGMIYYGKNDTKMALANLQKAFVLFTAKISEAKPRALRLANEIAFIYYNTKNMVEAEKWFQESVKLSEEVSGKDSQDTLDYVKKLAHFYLNTKNIGNAEGVFWRIRIITRKVFGEKSDEFTKASENYLCLVYSSERIDLIKVLEQRYNFERVSDKSLQKDFPDQVINGKAKKLVKPNYPFIATQQGISGTVRVKITVDENGKVVKARAYCGGDSSLREASENAAMKSTFSQTTVNGKAIIVTGTILYIFVPR